jgi:hypothetical protein
MMNLNGGMCQKLFHPLKRRKLLHSLAFCSFLTLILILSKFHATKMSSSLQLIPMCPNCRITTLGQGRFGNKLAQYSTLLALQKLTGVKTLLILQWKDAYSSISLYTHMLLCTYLQCH